MRIAIVGQRDFGTAVLEAFARRGDTVAGVFCAPEKPGEPADPLRAAAENRYLCLRLRCGEGGAPDAAPWTSMLGRAYCSSYRRTCALPARTIQFHPSLLPRYRGPSSINWPIILGDTRTGISIFRPIDGLDEGPIILQKETHIGPDESVGKVYFGRLFPMGVAALLEAADLVVSGRAVPSIQDESGASHEGWCRDGEARINWHSHVDLIHNLTRGRDPAPGPRTLFTQQDAACVRRAQAPRGPQVKGTIGTVSAIGGQSLMVGGQGGQIEVFKLKFDDGKKLPAPQVCAESGIGLGAILGA